MSPGHSSTPGRGRTRAVRQIKAPHDGCSELERSQQQFGSLATTHSATTHHSARRGQSRAHLLLLFGLLLGVSHTHSVSEEDNHQQQPKQRGASAARRPHRRTHPARLPARSSQAPVDPRSKKGQIQKGQTAPTFRWLSSERGLGRPEFGGETRRSLRARRRSPLKSLQRAGFARVQPAHRDD